VTDPAGVGIFDAAQGKSIARLARGYVVEIIGGPEVKRYTQAGLARDIIRWQVFSPRREGDDRRPITGWIGEGEIAAGIPTAQPAYWLQELVATWVCPDADYGSNLGDRWEVFVTQHGDGLALRDKPMIHDSAVKQRFKAGDILPVRSGYVCADRMIWWPVGLSGAVTEQWCSEGDAGGYLLAPLEV
jgi:hypothetical protein